MPKPVPSAVLFAMSAAFFLLACDLHGTPTESAETDDACEVVIRLSDAAAPAVVRTVLPGVSTSVARYRFSGVGPEGASLDAESAEPWLRARLLPGSWTVQVRGRNASGLDLLSGSASFLVETGASSDVSIALSPIEGFGSILLSFAMPSELPPLSALKISLSALGSGDNAEHRLEKPFSPLALEAVASGYHELSVRLLGASSGAGLSEIVRVLPNTRTEVMVDFASVPGAVLIGAQPVSSEPIAVFLPAWTARSAAATFSLEARAEEPLRWRLDGLPVEGAALAAPIPAGTRRLDARAASSDGRRAGSAGALLEFLPGMASGGFRWSGIFAPPAASVADLPSGHGFAAASASADGRRFAALDAPPPGSSASGNAARSAVHVFSVAAAGSPFSDGAFPVKSAGLSRSCDSLRLSPDGALAAVWKTDSSWIALGRVEGAPEPFAHIDAAALALPAALSVRDAVFSADSRSLLLLSGSSPHRLILVSLIGPPTVAWTASLDDPAIYSATFRALALHPSGAILCLSKTSDAAVLFKPSPEGLALESPPEIAAVFKRTTTGPSWLDGPVSCAPQVSSAGASFMLACADSGTVGIIGADGDGVPFAEAVEWISCGAGTSSLRVSSNGTTASLLESAGIRFFASDGSFASGLLDAGSPAAFAWIDSTRLFSVSADRREAYAFESDE